MPNYPIKIEPFRCNGAASLSTDAVQMRLIRSSFKEITEDFLLFVLYVYNKKVFSYFFETINPNLVITQYKLNPNSSMKLKARLK